MTHRQDTEITTCTLMQSPAIKHLRRYFSWDGECVLHPPTQVYRLHPFLAWGTLFSKEQAMASLISEHNKPKAWWVNSNEALTSGAHRWNRTWLLGVCWDIADCKRLRFTKMISRCTGNTTSYPVDHRAFIFKTVSTFQTRKGCLICRNKTNFRANS